MIADKNHKPHRKALLVKQLNYNCVIRYKLIIEN